MKKTAFLTLTLFFLLLSCNSSNVEGVHIRLKNVSTLSFETAYINTSGGEHEYGTVDPDDLTEYFEYNMAYSYAQVNLTIGGETFILQPIDYVGETPLDDGYYRYEIGIDNFDNKILNLDLKEE